MPNITGPIYHHFVALTTTNSAANCETCLQYVCKTPPFRTYDSDYLQNLGNSLKTFLPCRGFTPAHDLARIKFLDAEIRNSSTIA